MAVSPRGKKLYRKVWGAVTLAALGLMQTDKFQHETPAEKREREREREKNRPRDLVRWACCNCLPNGSVHLIPITILYDGEFYDASAYKARLTRAHGPRKRHGFMKASAVVFPEGHIHGLKRLARQQHLDRGRNLGSRRAPALPLR